MNRFTVIEKLFSEKRLPFPQLAYVVPLLTLLLTLALLIRPPQPALSQGEGILPWIVSASHTDGDEIPVDGGVAFRFNAPMNRASVEAAFQVSPYAPGRIEWQDDTRFSFTPYAPLDRATAYIFRLDSAARSLDGVPLRDVFSLKLTTPGHLSIAQYLPEDGSVFREAMPTITLVFNRPVVPLGTAEQMRRQPAPFVSTPAMVGEGEWLTTTIYSFKPTESLQGGTQYTITVPDTLADVSGSTLSEPFSFSFRTMETVIAPATFGLHYVAPDDGTTGIFRSPLIRVGFDSPADTASVEASFSLLAPDGRAIPGAFEWSEEKESFRFRPSELLDYATTYTIRIVSQNIRSATGLRLPLGVTQTFTTLEPPRITDTTPDDGTLVSPSTPFTVSFTTPMKLDDFAERITISPAAPFVFTDADIGPDSMSARVQFSLQPSTTYTVTLDTSDMVDIWNTPLRVIPQANVYSIVDGGKLQLRFLTGALSEAMSLETGGLGMGLYNAYHQTRVFVTHRNIDSIGLQLYDVPLETFLNLNTGGSGEGDPPPALLRRWVVPVYNPQNIMRYDLLAIGLNGDSIGQYNNISCVEAAPSSVRVGDTVRVVRRDMPAADAADAAGTATPGAPTAPGVPASINIRNEPGVQNTVVIGRAPHGTQFLVTDGPVCADRYLWWKVQPADGALSGWIAEGDLEQPYVIPITSTPVASIAVTATPAATQPATNRLAFASTEASLKPGIYRLQMETPDIQNDSGSLAHVLIVASDNITLKVARHGATAWVTDLKSGEPTPGVAVQFYRLMQMGEQQKMRPYGRPVFTDEDGLAVLDTSIDLRPASEPIVAVVQDAGRFGVTASGWTRGIDAGDFQQPTMYNNQDIALYVYTDRRLYRPGEPVYFRGTLRHRDDATYSMMDRIEVPVEIHDPNGQIVYDKTLPLSAYGSFSDSFVIDTSSPLGDYEIVARPNRPDTPPNQATPQPTPTLGGTPLAQQPFPVVEMQRRTEPDDPQFVTRITVGNYTPPEFRVMLTPEAQHVTVGGTVRVNVDSSYYFGGPVSDAVVQWTVRIDPYYFHYTGAGRYSFEDYDEDFIGQDYEDDRPQIVASGSGRTDHDGKYTIELPASLGRSGRSLIYSFEAILWDQSEQMVADRAQVVVDRGEFQVGVGVDRYVGVSGAPQNIRLIAVGHDSTPIADKRLRVRVVKRVWASVQTIEPGTGRTIWQNDLIEEPVLSRIVTTDRNGKAEMSFTPAHGGIYKIYVTAYDTQRRQIKASTFQWIGGPGFAPWREPNSNRITLQADKTDYKVGETASILIPTPFQGDAMALITVERGGILKTDVLALTSNSAIYDLEITPDMAPNAFVSVTVIKGEDATNFTPAFRTGLIGLNVDTEQLQLNVEVSADRDQAEPQEEVVYTVRVTDFRGQPVQAEIGLALVDEAVLALLPDNLPSLMAYFYSRQGLGVRTANALIYNVDQTTQEIINVQKGGGKGGGDYFGIFTIRKDFITTPLWQPFVVTDLSGVARVRVTLPDQLTTWVLDARAYSLPVGGSETTLVGQAMHSLISTRPLLIRPETPRFYVVGDTSVVSAIVNNNTDEAQDVVAILGAEGGALAGDPTLYATIPAHGRHKFDWPMTVEDSEGVDLVFRVMTTDGRYMDAAKPVTPVGSGGLIPVRRYETPDVTATSGVIGAEGGVRSEGVLVPLPFDDASRISDGDTLRLRVDRSLASGMFDAMRALEIEPYYCIEQVVSRFLPDVVTYQALAARSLDSDEARAAAEALHEQLSAELEAALQRLYNDQHYNGGWGWFIGDQTDQLISAYAVLGLAEARAAGWQIDENVLVQGVTALQRGLKTVDSQTPAWDLNRQAFILYVLARATQANANRVGDLMEPSTIYYDVSRTVSLFNQRDRMNIDARAFLAMTFHIIEPASGYHTQPLMESITRSALISPTGLHWQESFVDAWNWTTDTRTTAIVLKALVETDPSSPQIPDAVRWLMNARRFDRWETTQETAWSVMALSAFTRQTRDALPDYRFDVKLNDEALLTNQRATSDNARQPVTLDVPAAEMERDAVNRLDVQRTPGDGTLYYSAELRTYLPVEEVDALSRGLIVQRVYSLAEDEERTPITQARVGDLIRVTLTIIVPETLNYVAVEDPIPAGTQSVNTSLETTPRLDKDDPLRYGWTSWAFTHVELRDDRTVLYAPYLPRGTYQFIYELRAGAEGDYHVLPARGFAMYRPEVFGRTAGQMFTLLPAEPEPEPSEVYTF